MGAWVFRESLYQINTVDSYVKLADLKEPIVGNNDYYKKPHLVFRPNHAQRVLCGLNEKKGICITLKDGDKFTKHHYGVLEYYVKKMYFKKPTEIGVFIAQSRNAVGEDKDVIRNIPSAMNSQQIINMIIHFLKDYKALRVMWNNAGAPFLDTPRINIKTAIPFTFST